MRYRWREVRTKRRGLEAAMPRSYDQAVEAAQRELTASLYREGRSIREIADALGISFEGARKRLLAAGVPLRDRSTSQMHGCARRTAVPSDWSFIPITPHKAWLLGVIFGDGHVRKSGMGFVVTSGDRDVIQNIDQIFGGHLCVTERTYRGRTSSWQIYANSVRLSNELRSQFALPSRKADSLVFPHLPREAISHFARGLLDSDGHWAVRTTYSQPRLRFGHTSKCVGFLNSLRLTLIDHVGVSKRPLPSRSTNGTFSLSYNNWDAVLIGEWIYSGADSSMWCGRKHAVWARFAN
jgi:hypothetical protein